MCGIAGFTTRDGEQDAAGVLARMVGSLDHRGPDGSGVWSTPLSGDRRLALGHTRLAILDLSDDGLQPFHGRAGTPSAGLTITYNGEIYNF
ncbi:MAG: N-acetylglutaminylglutamine amidotransferase, partial [Caulobacterales bacterium]|nr:N-acetylglutaminylglutamine amidotransferase [Caulobacterales bacterium]